MNYRIVVVKSVPEFMDKIIDFARDSEDVWYRGEKYHYYHLEPSAYRYPKFKKNSATIEQKSIMSARSSMLHVTETHNFTLDLDWLCYLQHNGVPSRLLDWTFEFQVALYFAFEDYIYRKGKAGSMPCVWAFRPRDFLKNLGMYLRKNDAFNLNATEKKQFIEEMVLDTMPKDTMSVSEIDKKNKRLLQDAYVPFYSPFVNERAKLQGGCFIRFPLLEGAPDRFVEHRLESFVEKDPCFSDCLAKFIFLCPSSIINEISLFSPSISRIYPEVANISLGIRKALFEL